MGRGKVANFVTIPLFQPFKGPKTWFRRYRQEAQGGFPRELPYFESGSLLGPTFTRNQTHPLEGPKNRDFFLSTLGFG